MYGLFARGARAAAISIGIFVALATPPAHGQIIRRDALLHVIPQRSFEPFGLSAERAPAGPMWVRWREFERGLDESAAAVARCASDPASCSPAETRLIALIDMARHAQGRARFGLVNREINLSIAYTSDASQHGTGDVWSSALASIASGHGDCEDFAIAKYLVLREAGVAAENLRLLVGRVRSDGVAHAVLAARHEGRWLILDNRRMAMLDDGHADIQPIFTLDDAGVKQFGAPVIAVAVRDSQPAIEPASTAVAVAGGDALPLLM